jgi:hypothetical protein
VEARVDKKIELQVSGLGIVLYSPSSAGSIPKGFNFLSNGYKTVEQVQAHIQKGTIIGFGTGSPGIYVLEFHAGYPLEEYVQSCEFKLRLGLKCIEGQVCVRDLYDLLEWDPVCPEQQILSLEEGYYHLTICSNTPPSGVRGDFQRIDLFFQKLDEMPQLATNWIPSFG